MNIQLNKTISSLWLAIAMAFLLTLSQSAHAQSTASLEACEASVRLEMNADMAKAATASTGGSAVICGIFALAGIIDGGLSWGICSAVGGALGTSSQIDNIKRRASEELEKCAALPREQELLNIKSTR